MKTRIDSHTSKNTGKTTWVVMGVTRHLEIFPGMFSEIWETISPKFADENSAKTWARDHKKSVGKSNGPN